MDYTKELMMGENVMWDFRQTYVQWIDQSFMKDFTIALKLRVYPTMLEKLKDWHSAVWGRVIKDFNNDLDLNNDETFNLIIHNILIVANRYESTYLGKSKDPRAISELDKYFRMGMTYIVWLMKKNKMFGSESMNRSL